MALSLKTPLQQEYTLDKSDAKYGDGSSKTIVRFVQATQGAVELHDQIFSAVPKTYMYDVGVKVSDQKPQSYVKKMEVFATMSYCDITNAKGEMLFTFENGRLKDEAKFNEAWAQLLPDIADEIHEQCIKANPQWAPAGEV